MNSNNFAKVEGSEVAFTGATALSSVSVAGGGKLLQ